jgi:flavodoxin
MKKTIAFLLALSVLLSASALAEEVRHSDTLVVYFSCTGTTRGVAEKLANVTGADLYEIVPAVPYTQEDLNYSDRSTRASAEQDHPDTRPEIGGNDVALTGYSTVYIGYPIWWGKAPRILCTFVESHDFNGMTVIPFCTSGSSGIGRSGDDLAKLAGTGHWLEGARHNGSVSETELQNWVNGLK